MSEPESHARIPKLNDTNYTSWAIMTEAELTRKGLWTNMVEFYVDPDGKDEDEIEAAVEKLREARKPPKMAEARAEMILRVEPSQLSHMRDRDPKEVWDSLRNVHRARGFATSLALRRRFLTAKKGDSQTMQAWIGQIQAQAFMMEEAGIVVSEQDKILALTMGLPATYDPVIINFDSTAPDHLTFDHVVTRLLNEETRQTAGSGTAAKSPPEVAFSARVKPRRPISEITCFNCQKKGHYQSMCPDAKSEAATAATDADDIW
jgi:hypothetical protein